METYGVEAPKLLEADTYRWLLLDQRKGFPFNTSVPLLNPDIVPALQEKGLVLPFSRWTIGRKSNPNFLTSGSGFEGHICAFSPSDVTSILDDLQAEAYHIIKHDVGATALTTFLEDQSKPVGLRMITAGRIAFEIALARARAMRGMIERGGYYYTKDGQCKKIEETRKARSTQYSTFVYNAAPVVQWDLKISDKSTLFLDQATLNIPKSPIAVEFAGADIGTNNKYKLLAEIGRFGHPIVPLILRT